MGMHDVINSIRFISLWRLENYDMCLWNMEYGKNL